MHGLSLIKVSELQNIFISASRDEPMTPEFLFSSSSLLASTLIVFKTFHVSSSREREKFLPERSKLSKNIDFSAPFNSL